MDAPPAIGAGQQAGELAHPRQGGSTQVDAGEHGRTSGAGTEHPRVATGAGRPGVLPGPGTGAPVGSPAVDVIPLFPLGTPLFPGVVLPLQVFEPRYRRLVRDLLERPEGSARCFGVVAIRQGWEVEDVAPADALYDVGCTARLQAVRPQPDGGFRIVTVGGDRFRLLDLLVGEDPPYLQGRVEWLATEEVAADTAAGDVS